MARVTMCGHLANRAGWRDRTVDADTLSSLKTMLAAAQPALAGALDGNIVVIVNDVVTRGDAAIGATDEIAFLPPMSGG